MNYNYKYGNAHTNNANKCSYFYSGTHPFSEKETIAVRDFI